MFVIKCVTGFFNEGPGVCNMGLNVCKIGANVCNMRPDVTITNVTGLSQSATVPSKIKKNHDNELWKDDQTLN